MLGSFLKCIVAMGVILPGVCQASPWDKEDVLAWLEEIDFEPQGLMRGSLFTQYPSPPMEGWFVLTRSDEGKDLAHFVHVVQEHSGHSKLLFPLPGLETYLKEYLGVQSLAQRARAGGFDTGILSELYLQAEEGFAFWGSQHYRVRGPYYRLIGASGTFEIINRPFGPRGQRQKMHINMAEVSHPRRPRGWCGTMLLTVSRLLSGYRFHPLPQANQ